MTPFRPILSTTVVALLALGLQACDRSPTDDDSAPPQAAATAIDAAETAAAPLAATETTMAEAGVQPTAAGFDAKAFAGSFEGTLPCADCPAIDERLVLSADGSFELTDTYRERPGSEQTVRGSWALEPGGHGIRLDPGSKEAQDRLYAIEGNDALVPLDAEGRPTGAPGEPRLRRAH